MKLSNIYASCIPAASAQVGPKRLCTESIEGSVEEPRRFSGHDRIPALYSRWLRRAIRQRDFFPVRSLRYADPRKGLLSGVAWEAARPAICRTVGVSVSPDEELGKLSRRLDLAYRETAERVPENTAVTIVNTAAGPDLSVERLEKIDEPASLIALRMAVDARLSTLDLPELFLEMHVRTG
ncbi:hypothetical protein ELH26_35315 [Rhizobium leguminosarum]|uniref:hypothetical protein n=1 Tax=Rhizobium leguminosarum TaxID=384 RepID=UPI0010312AAF|nr:hypothetical protein [Rhizobium leguminosarum]TBC86558.1 hypothetical protein ELH26_35315 [Rhizobium leguminosarum]